MSTQWKKKQKTKKIKKERERVRMCVSAYIEFNKRRVLPKKASDKNSFSLMKRETNPKTKMTQPNMR